MNKVVLTLLFQLLLTIGYCQVKVDLDRSVPLWLESDPSTLESTLKWLKDDNASTYYISEVGQFLSLIPLDTLDGDATEFPIGSLSVGQGAQYHIRKGNTGLGIIQVGIELPLTHFRGRCLIAIDSMLSAPLEAEINDLIYDLEMDGWEVEILTIARTESVVNVKEKISNWYLPNYDLSQSLYILGHVPVPYSGNSAHDGHSNHQGAWAADVFYGDMDGNWTDVFVNNTTPSREANRNIPGDGKYDQTSIPSNLELEVGRVDFHNLPAFEEDEIELTRNYLNKSHAFKRGAMEYPRRALIENNFGSFAEGFGQSGWRNFTTMFGGDSVTTQNYETVLEDEKYLFSYACGGGSYTSCAGVGTTQNLWVEKDIKTIFTLNFGSYFGDWDSQNNFLRSALASGDVLSNAWAGRPVWQLYEMALGNTIGKCALLTQDASGSFYNQGNSAKNTHIALMGDPTLRLHSVKPVNGFSAMSLDGNIELTWDADPNNTHGYVVYRRDQNTPWQVLQEFVTSPVFTDLCLPPNTEFQYMVKAIRLEQTGSGSYYNLSLGTSTTIMSGENPLYQTYYADLDMDTFGDAENSTFACALAPGFVDNALDCDDTNDAINPNADEIPNNGIDEDCDGEDLLVGTNDFDQLAIKFFPNPTTGILHIENDLDDPLFYRIFDPIGTLIKSGIWKESIDISQFPNGLYQIQVFTNQHKSGISEFIHLQK